MYDNTSAGRDREMDVGSTSHDPTSRSSTATEFTGTGTGTSGTGRTGTGTSGTEAGTEYVSAAYTESGSEAGEHGPGGHGAKEKAAAATKTGARAASEGARDVAQAAKDEARQVAGEVGHQARRVATDVRDQLQGQARQQTGAMVDKLRQASDDMRQMTEGRDRSPAATLVGNLAERTNRFADHLESRGPEGVLADVQEFARRRPGTFLLAAAAAGFVVGRLGKSVLTAPNSPFTGGEGADGGRDYRDAYAAGQADTLAGFRSGTAAGTTELIGTEPTGTGPAAATTGTAAHAGGASGDTVPIRDDGGWNDPRPEAAGTPGAMPAGDPGNPLATDPLADPATAQRSRP